MKWFFNFHQMFAFFWNEGTKTKLTICKRVRTEQPNSNRKKNNSIKNKKTIQQLHLSYQTVFQALNHKKCSLGLCAHSLLTRLHAVFHTMYRIIANVIHRTTYGQWTNANVRVRSKAHNQIKKETSSFFYSFFHKYRQ